MKAQRRITPEVRCGSVAIKRVSGMSPDVMRATVSADGRLHLDPPLEFLVQPLDREAMHGA